MIEERRSTIVDGKQKKFTNKDKPKNNLPCATWGVFETMTVAKQRAKQRERVVSYNVTSSPITESETSIPSL
jgi:hypothetical protein